MTIIRKYEDYSEYVKHQSEKLDRIYWILTADGYRERTVDQYGSLFKLIIKYLLERKIGGKMICLGARLGEEVEAWRELGFDAIGIDLNPGPDNKWVQKGDFHNLEFPDESFDYVFSNTIDHVLYIDKFSSECHRVLKKNGRAIFEVRPHVKESVTDRFKKYGCYAGNVWYESFFWESQNELIQLFKDFGTWKRLTYQHFTLVGGPQGACKPRPILMLTK